IKETLTFTEQEQSDPKVAPYFTQYAVTEAAQILKQDRYTIHNSGYSIYTTLNTTLQSDLERTVTHHMDDKSELEVGALALDPETGEIRAMIGGSSYEKSTFNRAINAKRMVGSTIKPLVYYTALA